MNTKRVNFETAPNDRALIGQIVDRAMKAEWFVKFYREMIDCMMDITAVHANGCPLDLQKLLLAPDFDFAHDISGIHNCLDRKSGELKNGFLPRCSMPESAHNNEG